MSEQTYMKLRDDVKRPVLTVEKINRANTSFQRLVDEYENWNIQCGSDELREIYEEDIINCLFRYDLDGYALAEFLKDKCYLEPDSELVDILDSTTFVKSSLTKEIISQWVTENFLEVPANVIGKKVNANQGFTKYQNHYITGIKTETYEVTISEDPKNNGGWVVGYENISFVEN